MPEPRNLFSGGLKMSRGVLLVLAVVGLVTLMVGCSKSAPSSPEKGAEKPPVASAPETPKSVPDAQPNAAAPPADAGESSAQVAPATAPATPKEMTVAVGGVNEGPETPMGTVDVRFTLPSGWQKSVGFGPTTYGPVETGQPFPTRVTLSAGCNGNCDPRAIPANIDAHFAAFVERASRPNFNTGDETLDAVRADVTTLARFDLPAGRGVALAVDYAKELLASGPYQPQFQVLCVVRQPGDNHYVSLVGIGPLAVKDQWLVAMQGICQSLTMVGPTRTEAEGRPPVTVAGDILTLDQLPADSYEVLSTLSGKPSVISLKRPIVFKELTIAPLGRVYLETNDDPLTLRDVYLTQDQPFPMTDAGVEGDQVLCLRRQSVRISGEGQLRGCTLARALKVGPGLFPEYTEIEFEAGRFRRGQLAQDAIYPEATCMGGKSVTMDVADGGLIRCVLAAPLTVGTVSIPVGCDVKWAGPGLLRTVHLPEGAELTVGEEKHAGPGTASFTKGLFKNYRAAE
jgi:hypothetical protein